jgi:hypothetical protein
MNKEFVTYEQALALKELGFDEPCLAWYVSKRHGLELGQVVQSDLLRDAVIAPLKQQSLSFFREKYGLKPQITTTYNEWDFFIPESEYNEFPIRQSSDKWTYENYEENLINKLIELVKNK